MILLLGGTTEGLAVTDELAEHKVPFVLSVISDYGVELAHCRAEDIVEVTFTDEDLLSSCHGNQINFTPDATRSSARVTSQLTIDKANKLQTPYLRYERQNAYSRNAKLKMVDSLEGACEYLKTVKGNVYLSTGSKAAPEYTEKLSVDRLHVRVLPTARVMENLTATGLIASQIDAIRGPFTAALNYELFKRINSVMVVTKEGRRQGGIQGRITACEQLQIPCIIIRRPQLNYPAVVANLSELKEYLEENYEW